MVAHVAPMESGSRMRVVRFCGLEHGPAGGVRGGLEGRVRPFADPVVLRPVVRQHSRVGVLSIDIRLVPAARSPVFVGTSPNGVGGRIWLAVQLRMRSRDVVRATWLQRQKPASPRTGASPPRSRPCQVAAWPGLRRAERSPCGGKPAPVQRQRARTPLSRSSPLGHRPPTRAGDASRVRPRARVPSSTRGGSPSVPGRRFCSPPHVICVGHMPHATCHLPRVAGCRHGFVATIFV